MWIFQSEELANGRGVQVVLKQDSVPVAYADVLRLWQENTEFRSAFVGCLADAPYVAFRWETPAMTTAIASRPFEFVLLDSPGLARQPDAKAFAEHFGHCGPEGVVQFLNLGKDGIMVVPCPSGETSAYGHLAAFVRQAPPLQIHALWRQVGAAMQQRLSTKPVWLSTAGAGVSWLHVRLDDRPKYYGFEPYRLTK